jgi:hypothetical protein
MDNAVDCVAMTCVKHRGGGGGGFVFFVVVGGGRKIVDPTPIVQFDGTAREVPSLTLISEKTRLTN